MVGVVLSGIYAAVFNLVMWVNHFRMILYINTKLLMVYYVILAKNIMIFDHFHILT